MKQFFLRFPCYCGVLEGYARCRLCGIKLKIPTRGGATFLEHVREKKHMLRDSGFRLAHGLPLADEHGSLTSVRAVEWRVKLVDCRPVPVLETAIDKTFAEGIGLEDIGKSAWSSYFRSLTISISVARMCLALITEQLRSGSDLEQTDCQWSIVRRFPLQTEAMRRLFSSCKRILVSVWSKVFCWMSVIPYILLRWVVRHGLFFSAIFIRKV